MIRVFLDANILFSAAWREDSGISVLWSRRDVTLVTSSYALEEAQRNILSKRPAASSRLAQLVRQVELSSAMMTVSSDYGLPSKDVPILEAAAASHCSVLLTGDIMHFGHLLGQEAEGVTVMTVSMFLATMNQGA